jgi:hypothetical protein
MGEYIVLPVLAEGVKRKPLHGLYHIESAGQFKPDARMNGLAYHCYTKRWNDFEWSAKRTLEVAHSQRLRSGLA